ncbi:hypothetical protein [Fusobacterium necrophorum]|uniref:Uncharacterized protein n=1 Tax=Fusobacterium necrophorum subsp. funduliforme Fnf 1007 TaxID=1161424 RepID=A0AAN3VVX4_9FUSO|nr:hypothetical protein [Fusobacterium necrophorum]EJU17771.1 hypothetical protein HMPREF1127_2142 [Fusobacterium necrophorum subsp. funduliforme Fnf 1007]
MKTKEKIANQLQRRQNEFMEVFRKYDEALGEEREKTRQELELAEARVRELEIVLKMFEE